ncbi:hypothetical protein SJI00_07470 [Pseudomonas sp. RP23018S]|uniref:hypothetical protein n=1 Tax=Pseudomonas sp. RP23018S TaxID=3096037 RepID=UPI002ACACE46|nr:hypothetical protein [Pseudomonas sp. RP23018S]MDZ5602610.1 hypothetical protein [Pseudomonas sp. RP23018S]
MSVSPKDFHEQAIRLAKQNSEIDSRSAISRSYYYVYHCAVATAKRLSLPNCEKRDAGVHERLFLKFEAQGKALTKIARRLQKQKRLRGVADYDLDENVPACEAEIYLRETLLLTGDLERLGLARQEANK